MTTATKYPYLETCPIHEVRDEMFRLSEQSRERRRWMDEVGTTPATRANDRKILESIEADLLYVVEVLSRRK